MPMTVEAGYYLCSIYQIFIKQKTSPPPYPSPSRGEGREGVIPFGCGYAALYYCFAKSLNFVRHIWLGNASLKSPPNPPLERGAKGGFLELPGCKNQPYKPGYCRAIGLSFRFCFSLSNDPCVSVFIRVPIKFFGCGSAALGSSVSHKKSLFFSFCVHVRESASR